MTAKLKAKEKNSSCQQILRDQGWEVRWVGDKERRIQVSEGRKTKMRVMKLNAIMPSHGEKTSANLVEKFHKGRANKLLVHLHQGILPYS